MVTGSPRIPCWQRCGTAVLLIDSEALGCSDRTGWPWQRGRHALTLQCFRHRSPAPSPSETLCLGRLGNAKRTRHVTLRSRAPDREGSAVSRDVGGRHGPAAAARAPLRAPPLHSNVPRAQRVGTHALRPRRSRAGGIAVSCSSAALLST